MTQYHLILVWQPSWQTAQDCEDIARIVRERAPDIEVFVADNESPGLALKKRAGKKPSLIVSLAGLRRFKPVRGRVYAGRHVSKLDQKARMLEAGITTPKGALLSPDLELKPQDWGELVVVKPLDIRGGQNGQGVELWHTELVEYRAPEDFPDGHPGRLAPMMVEQFIDTGEHPTFFRVLTLFGEPLSAIQHTTLNRRPPLDAPQDRLLEAPINVSKGYIRLAFTQDDELLAFARTLHRALPDVPFLAADIVRCAATGEFYALELNPGQNTMRFSSDFWRDKRRLLGGREAMISQLGAWERAADVLIERTRAEAE